MVGYINYLLNLRTHFKLGEPNLVSNDFNVSCEGIADG